MKTAERYCREEGFVLLKNLHGNLSTPTKRPQTKRPKLLNIQNTQRPKLRNISTPKASKYKTSRQNLSTAKGPK
jgi:hypothetical protein